MVYKITLSQCEKDIFNILESIGDFVIVSKNNYIINTHKTKRALINKFNKVFSENNNITIKDISKDDIVMHSDVVKKWILSYDLESKLKTVSTEGVSNQALNILNLFVDSILQELENNQDNSERKET